MGHGDRLRPVTANNGATREFVAWDSHDGLVTSGVVHRFERKSDHIQEDLVMTAKKQIAKRYPAYLLARQIAALKGLSDDTETPVQFIIRQAIDEYLERRKKTKRRSL